jgi:hypothetical protein
VSRRSVTPAAEQSFALSWSHYVFLLGLNEQERKFYEIEATQQNWTLRDLKRPIQLRPVRTTCTQPEQERDPRARPSGARSFQAAGYPKGALHFRVPWTREQGRLRCCLCMSWNAACTPTCRTPPGEDGVAKCKGRGIVHPEVAGTANGGRGFIA